MTARAGTAAGHRRATVPLVGDEHLAEPLAESECRQLLRTAAVGRLGYTRSALPEIRPVTFALAGDDVLIPAREGSAGLTALAGTVVVLAVDSWAQREDTGEADGGGWSVSVVGPVHVLPRGPDGSSPDRVRHLCLRSAILRGWRVDPGGDGSAG